MQSGFFLSVEKRKQAITVMDLTVRKRIVMENGEEVHIDLLNIVLYFQLKKKR